MERGWRYSYRDRKQRKRAFRVLWIARINAAAREHDLSYSRFMRGLQDAGVEIDRKILAQLALSDPKAFGDLVQRFVPGDFLERLYPDAFLTDTP